MAGKIIADIIEAPYDAIRMNVANVTVLTANSSGLTYVPTGNVNVNIGSTASLTLGNVTVSNIITASAIKFPATQVPSSDANTLDDYEEGTFTPSFSNLGSMTFNVQQGRYIKIGKLVNCFFHLDVNSQGTASGTVSITNLPFTSVTGTNVYGNGGKWHCQSFNGSNDGVHGLVPPNASYCDVYYDSSNGAAQLTHVILGTGNILGVIIYETST